MFCAISGEPPKDPLVSKKSGVVYEKSLILKYVNDHNKDPVDGSDLTADDLIPLKIIPSIARPRPPSANSVPNILTSLQSEWDSTMLEMFQLRQQYNNVRSELSNALYELDAAKRVIARTIRERDSALKALAEMQQRHESESEQPPQKSASKHKKSAQSAE